MASEREHQHKIAQLDHAGLIALWQAIEDDAPMEWAPGKALEYLVLRAFELEGAAVRWPYIVEIGQEEVEQIDGVVYTGGLSCLLECKDTAQRTNVEPIAKLRNQLLRRPSSAIGLVVSKSGFTEAAIILARFLAPQTVLLWNGDELSFALQSRTMRPSLVAKYRKCVETGLPNFNITEEGIS